MRRLAAGAITVAAMGLLLWSGLRRGGVSPDSVAPPTADEAPPPPAPDPYAGAEDHLRSLLDCARSGDVDGYLASFAPPLRPRLEREADERGRDPFAADLRSASSARKSHALFAPEPDGPDACRIAVESVYPDRNERQTYRLERGPSGWLVTDIETARGLVPSHKYGSPAGFQAPEGNPVQAVEPGSDGAGGEGPRGEAMCEARLDFEGNPDQRSIRR